jgi:phosphatidylinositol alpha-1,6-mannosyltransferase
MRAGRVLVIARNLPPLRGGIERLMQQAVAELAREWRCDVIGPRGCAASLPAASAVSEVPARYAGFLAAAALHLVRAPPTAYRCVLASNGPMAPLARWAARRSG